MKKAFLTFCFLLGAVVCAQAEDPSVPAIVADTPHSISAGFVKSVSWSDPSKSVKTEIVVIDAAKKKVNIYISPTTTLWDSEAKAIMSDKIVPRSRVNVIYMTTPEGINIAKSIKLLK